MPREQRKINYLMYGHRLIPTKVINLKDFTFIDDLNNVPAEDYPRIFTVADGGMYSFYKPKNKFYFLLKKDIFNQQLKEISNESTRKI